MGHPKKAAVGPRSPKAHRRKRASRAPGLTPEIIQFAQESERETGVPASVTLGQWAWESGWGAHAPNNNPFGMKATKGQAGATLPTTEQGPSGLVKTKGKFRSFDTLGDAFTAHGEYVKRRFPWAMQHTDDPDEFVRQLESHPGVSYATDADYVKHITGIIKSHNFYQYDLKNSGGPAPVKVKDGEPSVMLGPATRMAAHVESPHTGGGKVIEGSKTVFVGPQKQAMSREGDASDDGYHLKTDVHSDILVG
jgi:hypothetical protein